MSIAISVRLPEFTANRLDELSRECHLSKTDLIVQGLESIFASRLDRKTVYLSDKQFDEVLDFINSPTPPETQAKIDELLSTPYPWESKQ